MIPDSKGRVANMGPTWVRQDPGGPHVGLMNLAIRDYDLWFANQIFFETSWQNLVGFCNISRFNFSIFVDPFGSYISSVLTHLPLDKILSVKIGELWFFSQQFAPWAVINKSTVV